MYAVSARDQEEEESMTARRRHIGKREQHGKKERNKRRRYKRLVVTDLGLYLTRVIKYYVLHVKNTSHCTCILFSMRYVCIKLFMNHTNFFVLCSLLHLSNVRMTQAFVGTSFLPSVLYGLLAL